MNFIIFEKLATNFVLKWVLASFANMAQLFSFEYSYQIQNPLKS